MTMTLQLSKYFALCLICSFTLSLSSLFGQEWEQYITQPGVTLAEGMEAINTSDGGYAVAGKASNWDTDTDSSLVVTRFDAQGSIMWTKRYEVNVFYLNNTSIQEGPFGNFYIASLTKYDNKFGGLIIKLDADGNEVWSINADGENMAFPKQLLVLDNGDFLLLAGSCDPNGCIAHVARYNSDGALMWTHPFDNYAYFGSDAIDLTSDGNIILAYRDNSVILKKISLEGEEIWIEDMEDTFQFLEEMKVDGNEDICIVGRVGGDFIFNKYDNQGDQISTQVMGVPDGEVENFTSLSFLSDGGYRLAGYYGNTWTIRKGFVFYLDETGSLNSIVLLPGGDEDEENYLHDILETPDGGFITTGMDQNAMYVAKFGPSDNQLSGTVFNDLNNDCQYDAPDDPPIQDWVISAKEGDITYYGNSNAEGDYQLMLPEGDFEVSATPVGPYWEACQDTYTITIAGMSNIVTQDLPFKTILDCPLLEVNVGLADILRICDTVTYTVSYCNVGNIPAEEAYLEVSLDEYLSYISSSIPLEGQQGNLLTFELGDLPINGCGTLSIEAVLDCNTDIQGFTHCVEAHIYPDSSCLDSPEWSGAEVTVEGECVDGNIQFSIQNIGDAATMPNLEYIVIEDEVIFMENNFSLDAQGMQMLTPIPATGGTFRLQAQQEPGFPWPSMPTVVLEGCTSENTGEVSTGFVNSFPPNDEAPFIDVLCLDNAFPYDPNDKLAEPRGYGEEHFIERNSELEYTIRFQNVGTSFAEDVVIRDTLSEHLNPASIRPGVSSHDYTFELTGQGIAIFTFEDIILPDSTSDPAGSQGFVHFRIHQQPDLPLGTVIENNAAIFFDFNEPIITNKAFHTIGENFVVINEVVEPGFSNLALTVAPNPFRESTWLTISGVAYNDASIQVFDATGKLVRSDGFSGKQYALHRRGLSGGLYFFQLYLDGKPAGSGKLVIR